MPVCQKSGGQQPQACHAVRGKDQGSSLVSDLISGLLPAKCKASKGQYRTCSAPLRNKGARWLSHCVCLIKGERISGRGCSRSYSRQRNWSGGARPWFCSKGKVTGENRGLWGQRPQGLGQLWLHPGQEKQAPLASGPAVSNVRF